LEALEEDLSRLREQPPACGARVIDTPMTKTRTTWGSYQVRLKATLTRPGADDIGVT
jgi:hypothetical protein